MGKLPTLGKFWGNFGRKGKKEEGKGEGKRGGKGKERHGKGGKGEEKKGNCIKGEEKLKMENGRERYGK